MTIYDKHNAAGKMATKGMLDVYSSKRTDSERRGEKRASYDCHCQCHPLFNLQVNNE